MISLSQHIRNDDLSELIEKARKKYNVPGVSLIVFNHDEVVNHCVAGIRRTGDTLPISKDNYFHIGSTSKSILAVLAGKQVEFGNIRWDTKYFDLFPEAKDSALIDYHHISLEDLFLCKAGIKPFTEGSEKFPELAGDFETRRHEFARWLFRHPPASGRERDGKYAFVYSNAGYALIALMLERASGKNYDILLSEFLKDYLSTDFIFGWPNNYDWLQAWGHANFDFGQDHQAFQLKKNSIRSFEPGHSYKLNDLIRPAGDISMKPLDFALVAQNFLNGLRGTDNYVGASTYRHIAFSRTGFSLGVVNSKYLGKQIVGFDGSAGTFYCRAMIVPKSDVGFTIMINSGSQDAVNWITKKTLKKQFNWWWKFWV